ncbi:MAG: NAD(P)H-hydrate dehydratase [Candidatus Omnitrophica bacterium]|nr:NAD(P)H-hydrate dehydratase [Candidatus Omnitrophota bacterium]
MTEKNINRLLPARKPNSHKGDYGHILILAGSLGLTGAAYLASQGAVLSGSGLVTLGIPKSLNTIMEVKLTEAMTKPLPETKDKTLSLKAFSKIKGLLGHVDALAIGPGISRQKETVKLVHKILINADIPIVLDADGINALENNTKVLTKLKASLIITPHPGEISRILRKSVAEIQKDRIKIAKGLANTYNIVVALKGHHTVVADRTGKTYINNTGNAGMASGGCGDVLTGMIASLLGQGMAPFIATKLAVYVHGLAGDLAKKEKGEISLTATDLLNKLPAAFKQIG